MLPNRLLVCTSSLDVKLLVGFCLGASIKLLDHVRASSGRLSAGSLRRACLLASGRCHRGTLTTRLGGREGLERPEELAEREEQPELGEPRAELGEPARLVQLEELRGGC